LTSRGAFAPIPRSPRPRETRGCCRPIGAARARDAACGPTAALARCPALGAWLWWSCITAEPPLAVAVVRFGPAALPARRHCPLAAAYRRSAFAALAAVALMLRRASMP
ncbi:unnamed protein product, partial [Urochloa humidicola]